jgi:serine/threonine protein kinase, bacterial
METARSIFYAFLSELFFFLVAWSVKDDKKKVLIILSAGTILSGIIGFSPIILKGSSPTQVELEPTIASTASRYTQTASLITFPTSTRQQNPSTTQSITKTPDTADKISPEMFVRNYFDAINSRNYEASWSMLSSQFQANYTYNEYTSFWDTVDKVEILLITIKSQNASQVLIYVESHYYYKADYTTTAHTTYKLVKNGNSWLFDPN